MERPKRFWNYDKDNHTAYWSPEGEEYHWHYAMSPEAQPLPENPTDFDRMWNNYEYTNDRNGGWKTRISPRDFLRLTMGDNFERKKIPSGDGGTDIPLDSIDVERFESNDQPIGFEIDEKGNIVSHQGRHRAWSMMKDGIEDMDIMISPTAWKNFDKRHPKDISGMELRGQVGRVRHKLGNATAMNKKSYDERKKSAISNLFGRDLK